MMPLPLAMAFSIVSVTCLAIASNVFVEVPALKLKKLIGTRRVTAAAVAAA